MVALSENFITADDDLETTVGRVTNAAVDLIDGIDYADVLLVQRLSRSSWNLGWRSLT
jgi:hypothetical protein